MITLTERVMMVIAGGAAVVAVVALMTGADLAELVTIILAFAAGSALPSPLMRQGG